MGATTSSAPQHACFSWPSGDGGGVHESSGTTRTEASTRELLIHEAKERCRCTHPNREFTFHHGRLQLKLSRTPTYSPSTITKTPLDSTALRLEYTRAATEATTTIFCMCVVRAGHALAVCDSHGNLCEVEWGVPSNEGGYVRPLSEWHPPTWSNAFGYDSRCYILHDAAQNDLYCAMLYDVKRFARRVPCDASAESMPNQGTRDALRDCAKNERHMSIATIMTGWRYSIRGVAWHDHSSSLLVACGVVKRIARASMLQPSSEHTRFMHEGAAHAAEHLCGYGDCAPSRFGRDSGYTVLEEEWRAPQDAGCVGGWRMDEWCTEPLSYNGALAVDVSKNTLVAAAAVVRGRNDPPLTRRLLTRLSIEQRDVRMGPEPHSNLRLLHCIGQHSVAPSDGATRIRDGEPAQVLFQDIERVVCGGDGRTYVLDHGYLRLVSASWCCVTTVADTENEPTPSLPAARFLDLVRLDDWTLLLANEYSQLQTVSTCSRATVVRRIGASHAGVCLAAVLLSLIMTYAWTD